MSRFFLGVDVGGTNTKIAVIDRRARVLQKTLIQTRPDLGPLQLFRDVRKRVEQDLTWSDVRSVGVGCAGLIDRKRGWLSDSPNLPAWRNSPLGPMARRVFQRTVHLENDVNAAAWAEYLQGTGQGATMLVCIALGTGVGGAIVYDGQLVRGAKNYAGEVGHMTVNPRGPRCKCGSRGCLEAYLGASAIVRSYRARNRAAASSVLKERGGRLDPRAIVQLARAGDASARHALDNAGEYLGIAIASLINILNPDMIAIGGGVGGAFP